jgi:hypothetical protein
MRYVPAYSLGHSLLALLLALSAISESFIEYVYVITAEEARIERALLLY